MEYREPKITFLGQAVAAIQGGSKDESPADNAPDLVNSTTGAYEADE